MFKRFQVMACDFTGQEEIGIRDGCIIVFITCCWCESMIGVCTFCERGECPGATNDIQGRQPDTAATA